MTAEEMIELVKQDYLSCPNMMSIDGSIYCHTWYRHDDCERLRELLFKITNDLIYTRPGTRQEVKDAIVDMLTDPYTSEILRRLKD
jgi:RNase P/RNase MRP subunit p30